MYYSRMTDDCIVMAESLANERNRASSVPDLYDITLVYLITVVLVQCMVSVEFTSMIRKRLACAQ